MDTEAAESEANIMDVQSLKSFSESSEGSGVNIRTPTDSVSGDKESSKTTPNDKPFEDEAVLVDSDQISDWLDKTESALSEPAADMTLITHDETNSLGGSTYELIDDDIESSHGAETESISDCSISRPSDVVSLAEDENSMDDTESEASISHSAIPAYAGLDDNEDTPRVGLSTANVHNETSTVSPHGAELQHIAFEEPQLDGAETASLVSVMHTVREFSREEAGVLALQIDSGIYPRCVGTIRQIMTKEYLSLTEPLRIMYVGSHQARQDILQKLGSSVAASRDDNGHGVQSSQLYNVVPISAFGSGKTPEVELTQSSAVQFKVCDLQDAVKVQISEDSTDPRPLRLALDHNSVVLSIPTENGFEISPANWEKPHIAVFYCSDTDTDKMKRVLENANSFMQRHNIPRIVISHKPLFDATPKVNLRLGHQPIHMCIESRSPQKSSNSIHFRLPIDLTSFLNIDARQMNRNLACITGLYEGAPIMAESAAKKKNLSENSFKPVVALAYKNCVDFGMKQIAEIKEAWMAIEVAARRAPVSYTIFAVVLGLLIGFLSGPAPSAQHAVVHHNGTVAAPLHSSVWESAPPATTTTSYTTTTRTTTITVTLAPTSTTVSPPKVSGKPAAAMDPVMYLISSFNSAELEGEREVVLRTSKINAAGMKKDSNLAFRLWRELRNASEPCSLATHNKTVMWEKAWWTEHGVSIALKKEDVHGMLKIGVESVSGEGRRIRKTYNVKLSDTDENAVTLGQIGRCLHDEVVPLLVETTSRKLGAWGAMAARQAHVLAHKSNEVLKEAKKKFQEAKLQEQMRKKMELMREVQAQVKKQAEKGEQMVGEAHKVVNEKLLKAQVKSRLIWLRKKGMWKEAREYEAKARAAGVLEKGEVKEGEQEKGEGEPKVVPKKKCCARGWGRKARRCRAANRG